MKLSPGGGFLRNNYMCKLSLANRINDLYFQNEIENVPFEKRQVKKLPIRREYNAIFVFPNAKDGAAP